MRAIILLMGRRVQASLAIVALGVGWIVCLATAWRGGIMSIRNHRDLTDHHFYRAVAERVGMGAKYYDVVAVVLPRHGYPTGSTFNWRTPLYAHALGRLGGTVANRVALATMATVAAALASVLVARVLGTIAGLAAGLLVAASSAWWAYPEPPYFTEVWAGLLILAAIAGRGLGFVWSAFLAGTLALFLRELALPFVGLCLAASWAGRRLREAIAWGVCLALYAVHLAGHVAEVASRQVPRPGESVPGWVDFGGLGFLLATTRMNYALSLLPDWCAAVYLPLAIFGLVALGSRLAEVRWLLIGMNGYLLAFAVVGKEFNYYWGWITAPTFALGFAVAPFFLVDAIGVLGSVKGRPQDRSLRKSG